MIVSENDFEPWQMGKLDNMSTKCRITIPDSAEAVIVEIKIWDRP